MYKPGEKPKSNTDKSLDFDVFLPEMLWQEIMHITRKAAPSEIGGLLLTEVDLHERTIDVVGYEVLPQEAHTGAFDFDEFTVEDTLKRFGVYDDTDGTPMPYVHYGTWHSHGYGDVCFSARDEGNLIDKLLTRGLLTTLVVNARGESTIRVDTSCAGGTPKEYIQVRLSASLVVTEKPLLSAERTAELDALVGATLRKPAPKIEGIDLKRNWRTQHALRSYMLGEADERELRDDLGSWPFGLTDGLAEGTVLGAHDDKDDEMTYYTHLVERDSDDAASGYAHYAMGDDVPNALAERIYEFACIPGITIVGDRDGDLSFRDKNGRTFRLVDENTVEITRGSRKPKRRKITEGFLDALYSIGVSKEARDGRA